MKSQTDTVVSSKSHLGITGVLVLLLLVLYLIGPLSAWVYFGLIWLIPVGLGLVDLSQSDPDEPDKPLRSLVKSLY